MRMTDQADAKMAALLKQVMEELEVIGEAHDELYDTDIKENLFEAVCAGFVKPQAGFRLFDDFGLASEEANHQVQAALARYLQAANERALELGLTTPRQRLHAFQNGEVCTDEGQYPDDFFGWAESID
jgi:hypothetical protein